MHALVATTRFLLLVDVSTRKVTPLEGGRPEYYGISWFPGGDRLVLTHSGLDNAELVDLQSYARSETGWISHGEGASMPFLSQPHQMLCASDGRVVCTNTGRNAISVIDLRRPGHFQEARVGNARWDRLSIGGETADHLNSVFERHGKLYVIAHRHDKGAMLAVFDYPELGLISLTPVPKKTGLHNIWVNDEGMYVSCHSEAGCIIDIAGDRVLWDSGSPVYTRGLAASAEFVLVGESQKLGRDLRRSSMSGLWVIERETWRAVDYINLGPYGAVNEVRLVDVVDHAHHGHPFNGLNGLFARNLQLEIATERLQAAATAAGARARWAHLELLLGAPTSDSGGGRSASSEQICLAVAKQHWRDRLVFDYRLDASVGKAHVSAVADYSGSGGDKNMSAFLLQPAGDMAVLSLWQNDGQGWKRLPGVVAERLPLHGRMEIARQDGDVVIGIERESILRLEAARFGIGNGPFGMRWLGARVVPEEE